MRAYFDTSLLVTWILQEPRWAVLKHWIITSTPVPHFSDFGWGEFVSALGLKVRRGEMIESEAADALAAVTDQLKSWIRLRVPREDLLEAASMVEYFRLGLRFPDAIHIATARRTRCVLITADDRQLSAAGHFGLDSINPYFHVAEQRT